MSARLVAPEALAARLGDPALRVLDATVILDRPPEGGPYGPRSGRASFEDGHVPGAGFADLIDAFAQPPAAPGPADRGAPHGAGDAADPGAPQADGGARRVAPQWFAWPSPGRFAAAAGALGIGDGVAVVVYAQDAPMWATRLWFLLRAHGHDGVAVLDGGLPAWRAAGLPVGTGPPDPVAPRTFTARPRPELLASRTDVERIARDGGACLVNALRPAAFRGEGPSAYSRPGRIPRSVNVPHPALYDEGGTNRFAPAAELRERFAAAGALGDEPVVAYCGGGISATLDLFALALAGRDDGRLYDGSLAEWSADPALPLETG